MTVRARLTLWHSGLLAVLVLAFAVAGYTFLRRTELERIDSTLQEQSEIVTQAMRAARVGGDRGSAADTARLLSTLHDLRARSLRAWVLDGAHRPVVSTAMVHEGEGEAEEREILGDSVPLATLQSVAGTARTAAVWMSIPTETAGVRLYARPLPADVGPGTIVVAHSLRDLRELLAHARSAAIVAVALAVVLSMLAGYGLARHSLRPVAQMSGQASRIGAANLHERLPIANPDDELGMLASTFNSLLDRITNAFEQQRRFMADASHELRTPVAIMRGEADVALGSNDRTRDEYRDALAIVRAAADRLTRTVNDVFLLARVDAGQVPPNPTPLYLDELVAESCRAMRTLALPRAIELHVDVPGDVPYVGDEMLLARLVTNLVDNAIKYSDDAGVVCLRLAQNAEGVCLKISNTGRGIPADARS
ncbi:MAG: histidine kinase dimerization/phospho-acceptor domain-containing protein, partial [Gemmatimonadaceae bacterium]